MNGLIRIAVPLLALCAVASAFAVVWSKHEARNRFIELQGLNDERDRLDIEWGQLKLEQSTWAMHGRVEQVARDELKMIIPKPAEIRIVEP